MSTRREPPVTELCTHSLTEIRYRGRSLVDDLIGQRTFTEVLFAQILAREASPAEARMLDAILVTLMEHGMTPSAIATRLIYMSAPESLQGAVAAGLLAVGSQFVGTMENAAGLLTRLVDDPRGFDSAAAEAVARYRKDKTAIPGFGHHLHKPDDPRAQKLIATAKEARLGQQRYIPALERLSTHVDREFGRHITINATGAIGAILADMDIPPTIMRGFATISRAAGLVAHVAEEQRHPSGRYIWQLVDEDISKPQADR